MDRLQSHNPYGARATSTNIRTIARSRDVQLFQATPRLKVFYIFIRSGVHNTYSSSIYIAVYIYIYIFATFPYVSIFTILCVCIDEWQCCAHAVKSRRVITQQNSTTQEINSRNGIQSRRKKKNRCIPATCPYTRGSISNYGFTLRAETFSAGRTDIVYHYYELSRLIVRERLTLRSSTFLPLLLSHQSSKLSTSLPLCPMCNNTLHHKTMINVVSFRDKRSSSEKKALTAIFHPSEIFQYFWCPIY